MLNTDFNFSQQLPTQYIDLFAYGLTCVAWYYQNMDVVFKCNISNDNYTHVTTFFKSVWLGNVKELTNCVMFSYAWISHYLLWLHL